MDFANEYFTLLVLSPGTITFTTSTPRGSDSAYIIDIDYSVNGGIWEGISSSTAGTLLGTFNIGDRIRIKGTQPLSNKSKLLYSNYFGGTAEVEVYGNILSLVHGDNFTNFNACTCEQEFTRVFYNYSNLKSAQHLVFPATCYELCYEFMFENSTGLTIAPEQLSTTLAEACYSGMFKGCTSLQIIPSLPVTTLAPGCYKGMFKYCTSLITPPELPATTLTEYCYDTLFYGCTNLASAPELPATNLKPYCYANMFEKCSKLEVAPELPALILKDDCYNAMFMDCYSLKKMPELPATTLTPNCYSMMFYTCSSLETASILPATNLESGCYSYMFYGCSNLMRAPELPATTLKSNCYDGMFMGCLNLTSAPLLPATTLVSNCYRDMFWGCNKLNFIRALFTTTPSDSYTYDWVSSVASSGTFVKNSAAGWSATGTNAVPVGWNIKSSSSTSTYSFIDPNFTVNEVIDIQDIISWSNIDVVTLSNWNEGYKNVFILNNWARTFPWAQETILWQQIKDSDRIQFLDANYGTTFARNYHYEEIAYLKNNYSDWDPYLISDTINGSGKDEYGVHAAVELVNSRVYGYNGPSSPGLYDISSNSENKISLNDIFNLTFCNFYTYNPIRLANNISAFLALIYVYFALTPYFVKTSDTDGLVHILGDDQMINLSIQINKRIVIVNNKLNLHGFSNYSVLQHAYTDYEYLNAEEIPELEDERPIRYYKDSNNYNYSCQSIFPIFIWDEGGGINWEILKVKRIGASNSYNIVDDLSVLDLYNIIENYTHYFNCDNAHIIHGIFNDSSTNDILYILTSSPTYDVINIV